MDRKREKKAGIISVIKLSMKISMEASVFFSAVRMFCSVINSFLPTIKLLIMKYIIDALLGKLQKETLIYVALYVFTQIVSIVVDKLNVYSTHMHSEKIGLKLSTMIVDKVGKLDVSYFDNPKLYDEMGIVTRDGGAISKLFWNLISLIGGMAQLMVSFFIISEVGMIYGVILILTTLPYFFVERHNEIEAYIWNRNNENKVRKINYLYRVLIDKYFAIDIRVNNLFLYMKDKYISFWNIWFNEKKDLIKKHFTKTFFSVFLSNMVITLFVVFMAYDVLFKDASISDFTYYLGIATQLVNYAYYVLSGFSSFKQMKMKTESFYTFMGWESLVSNRGKECVQENFESIRFEHVSFAYPNCQEYILKDVSFEIHSGEKILLIGNNGAGKSTLIKLLLRLYEPTSGKIYLNGKQITEYSQEEYYKLFSYFPQNYVNYAFTVRENISCNYGNVNDERKIMESINKVDLTEVLSRLQNGIETYLTKQFDAEGAELSVGEWQKMALARFLHKESSFKILDEPSASLDAFSQEKIISLILDENEDNTVLLVSHRPTNMKRIERIISLCDGEIVEDDTPQQLEMAGGFFSSWISISS